MQKFKNQAIYSSLFQGLELIPLPVALADLHLNILHFNEAFGGLIAETSRVFPTNDMESVFPGFKDELFKVESNLSLSGKVVVEGFIQQNTGKIYDFHVSQIDKFSNHLEGLSISCIDVTAKVMQLRPLVELGQHHLQLLKHTKTGVVIHRNGIIVYANEQADALVGLPLKSTLKGRDIWTFISTSFKSAITARINKLINEQIVAESIEEQFIRWDGTTLDVEVFAFPVKYEGNVAIKTIFTDISDRKKAERLLESGNRQYHTLVENLTDVVFQTDTDANFIFLNNSWEKLTGFKIDTTLGNNCFNYLIHPHDTEGFYQKVRKLLVLGLQDFQYDLMLNTANGKSLFVEVSLKPILNEAKEIIGINGIIRDIHAKKMADIAIKQIQNTLKHHQQVLVSLTKEETIISGDFNKALTVISKITATTLNVSNVNVWKFSNNYEELICIVNFDRHKNVYSELQSFKYTQFPKYFDSLINERVLILDDALNDSKVSEFKAIYLEPKEVFSMLDVAITEGDAIWGIICIENKFEQHKWTLEDQSFARSIADFISLALKSSLLKATQMELLQQENLYHSLVEQATDAIIIIDSNNKFIEVNNAMCTITGYSKAELRNMTIDDLTPNRLKAGNVNLAETFRRLDGFFGERTYVNKKGEERIAEISTRVFDDGTIQGIARDITARKLQEQALRDSEARLNLALKGADLGVWDFYIQENRMVHNDNWAEMLGYYFESKVVNQEFWEKFIHPDDKESAKAAFQLHLSGATPFYEATLRMLASNGEWRWILDKGKISEWDAAGKPLRASGIHQDITTIKAYQQKLIQQRKFSQELINASPNLIYVRNSNKEFVTVNNTMLDFLSVKREQILNYDILQKESFSLILDKIAEKDNEVFYNRKQVVIEEQAYFTAKGNNPVWLKSIKIPLFDEQGGFSELLSVSMDITEIKKKEYQLSLLNDSLELKVIERTAMLEAANKELETFNYSVSHDLRTPLRSIDIFAYFLDKNYSQLLDKDGIENIRQIRRSITKMSSLIDNLLIFSKIGRSDQVYVAIDTNALIEEVISEFKERDEFGSLKLVVGIMPAIYGDYQMLKRVFINLISNGIKFTKTRKKPVLDLFGYYAENYTTIGIRDNGVGFNIELKEKLFKALKRLHSDEQFEGSGVGLAIVERIVKRHNGTLWAESKEGKGSTFYFRIPENKNEVAQP